jgi:hypothetical protein
MEAILATIVALTLLEHYKKDMLPTEETSNQGLTRIKTGSTRI